MTGAAAVTAVSTVTVLYTPLSNLGEIAQPWNHTLGNIEILLYGKDWNSWIYFYEYFGLKTIFMWCLQEHNSIKPSPPRHLCWSNHLFLYHSTTGQSVEGQVGRKRVTPAFLRPLAASLWNKINMRNVHSRQPGSPFLLPNYGVSNRENKVVSYLSSLSLFMFCEGVHQDILGIPRNLEVAANHAIVTAMASWALVTP